MTVKPSTIFTGDNLDIMRGMDDASIDLIYLDPPFNSNKNYAAPIGSKAAGAAFKDTWTLSDVDNAWHGEIADAEPAIYSAIAGSEHTYNKGMKAYLIMMAVRLIEMRRILKNTGSIYLHCDPTASHYLKALMDGIFGKEQFKNEIVWRRASIGKLAKRYGRAHDVILFYTASSKFTWTDVRKPRGEKAKPPKTYRKEGDRYFRRQEVCASPAHGQRITYKFKGYTPPTGWLIKKKDLIKLDSEGLIGWTNNSGRPYRKQYWDGYAGTPIDDFWDDIKGGGQMPASERLGYPTQKPLALLQRIIRASSNEGDTILDPFCGCATACLAAQIEHRNWIGIDISKTAYKLVNSRLKNELGGLFAKPIHRTDIPKRKGIKPSKDIKHKLFGQQEGRCNGCQETFNFRNFHLDHIIPKSKGGGDYDDNLQLLCGWCNSKKGDRPMEYLIAALKSDGIYGR